MYKHDATEQAYKNGYEQGKKDAVKHSRWITVEGLLVCKNCKHTTTDVILDYDEYNSSFRSLYPYYCGKCGSKMDLKGNGEK